MYILGSCNILFYFNLLINIYPGVFVGDSFCPKGFVLLDGQQVCLSILFESCLEKWGVHYIFGCTLYKRKYGIPTHNIQKLFSNTLWKKGNCAEINCLLLFSIILKVFLLLDFIKRKTCRREKTPSFFDDSNENSRIIPSHLCCDISAKDCQSA